MEQELRKKYLRLIAQMNQKSQLLQAEFQV